MSHCLQDSAGSGSSSDKDFPASPAAQATPMSPTQIASFVQGSSKDNNALSEKYKKLKRRFFELEEVRVSVTLFLDHKERKSPDSGIDDRNIRKRVLSCNARVSGMYA